MRSSPAAQRYREPGVVHMRDVRVSGLALPYGEPCFKTHPESPTGLCEIRFEPGAFELWCNERQIFLTIDHNHDGEGSYGSVGEGNLRLWECRAGLAFMFAPRLDAAGERLVADLKRGKVYQGVSASFDAVRLKSVEHFPYTLARVKEATIKEISICRKPAYKRTGEHLTLFCKNPHTREMDPWDPISQRTVSRRDRSPHRMTPAYYAFINDL